MSGQASPQGGWRANDQVALLIGKSLRAAKRYPSGEWYGVDGTAYADDALVNRMIEDGETVVYIHAPRPEPVPVGGDVREALEAACLEGLIDTEHGHRYRPRVGADAILARFDVTPRDGDTVRAPREAVKSLRTVYSVQIWVEADGVRDGWCTGYGYYTNSRDDAEAMLQEDRNRYRDESFRLAAAELTDWREVES